MRRCGTLITMISKEPVDLMDGEERKRKGRDETKTAAKKRK